MSPIKFILDERLVDLTDRLQVDARLVLLGEVLNILRDIQNLLGYNPTEQF